MRYDVYYHYEHNGKKPSEELLEHLRITDPIAYDLAVNWCDGKRSYAEIAKLSGYSRKQINSRALKYNLPRRKEGAGAGVLNHQYNGGRNIDKDGYVLVPAPPGYEGRVRQRAREGRRPLVLEHRLVMERKLGRLLRPEEVVDHIDGLTLHNAPENLRLFESNAEHLRETLAGKPHLVSPEGQLNIHLQKKGLDLRRVDSYAQRKKAGDVRLRQILLAALKLGPDSPFLSGTTPHTKKAGIDLHDRSMIERVLDLLYERWALGQTLLQQGRLPEDILQRRL